MNPFADLARPLIQRPGDPIAEDEPEAKRRRAGRATIAAIPEVENPWRLKPSQCAIMAGLVAGKTNDEMAGELGVTRKTVECHRSTAVQVMHARNSTQAAVMWDRFIRGMGQ